MNFLTKIFCRKQQELIRFQAGRIACLESLLRGSEYATAQWRKRAVEIQNEVDGWKDSAAMFHRGCEFYQGLIRRCGKAFGEVAYVSDDGSVQDQVLALKVPELVEELVRERDLFTKLSPFFTLTATMPG